MLKKRLAGLMIGCAAVFGAAGAMLAATPTIAYAQEGEGEPRRRSETLDPNTGRVLQSVFEKMQAEQYSPALEEINGFINSRGEGLKPYDKSTTYEIRGTIYINLENYPAALRDFQTALSANGLPPERNNQLRYNIAQIQFQLEQYQQAINGLNQWIQSTQAAGGTVDPNAYYLLAAAYTQITPPNFRAALDPAERVVAARGSSADPKKGDFDLLNLVYSELGESTKRAALLERMVNLFPGERSYWSQLAGLYSTTGRDQEAFAVLEVAYRAGLIEREGEIITLVNYYSFFDNPWRGAKLLSREIEAGRVKRNLNNLILLSQLYSQAREQKRAIPVLREASQLSNDGELSYRLGQVLLADEQYARAEQALVSALNKGGMSPRQTGDAWLLLGTARFSQAGPGDRAIRSRARQAFVNATRYSDSSRQAREWVTYIDAINSTERAQDELERQQRVQAVRDNVERLRTQLQVCRLQGNAGCEEFETRIREQQEELRRLEASSASADEDADEAGGGDAAASDDDGDDEEADNEDAAAPAAEADEAAAEPSE
ncbi:MAG: hypothetical protein GC152_03855 [Alphaproteobacteria bacterium]|nr:hypothetical protein [Alphaproteobacteria bacterium]